MSVNQENIIKHMCKANVTSWSAMIRQNAQQIRVTSQIQLLCHCLTVCYYSSTKINQEQRVLSV